MPLSCEYLAGFVDGEGCLRLARLKTQIVPYLYIANTNKEILELIQAEHGGTIFTHKHKNKKWKTGYSLRIGNRKCLDFVRAIYPYLIIKKAQADLLFQWDEWRPGNSGSKSRKGGWDEAKKNFLLERCSELNKKGQPCL